MSCFCFPQVKALAGEVVAHLRSVAGADALLAAYNEARRCVAEARVERRRQRTLQARASALCCGPEHCAGGSRGCCGLAQRAALRHHVCTLLRGRTSLPVVSFAPGNTCCSIGCITKWFSAGRVAHQALFSRGQH